MIHPEPEIYWPLKPTPPLNPPPLNPPPLNNDIYDVVIVGGGIVGSIAACGLAQVGLRVALIEAQAQSFASTRGQAYSINLLSAQVFQDLGLWDTIRPKIEAYRNVRLSDGDYAKVVHFKADDLTQKNIHTDTIGYVAEHRVLLEALQSQLIASPTIDWICPATVTSTTWANGKASNFATVTIDRDRSTQTLQTRLVVGADGSQSPLRTQSNIRTFGWQYWQSCIVAFIQPEIPHHQVAHERFQPDGPFAILPLPNGLCRIVWTAPRAEADRILKLDRTAFMTELHQRYGDHMGALTLVGEPSVFPVRLLHSTRYVQPQLALIGDAAHCCHPVGGQGINLGIRDAAALCETIDRSIQQSIQQQGKPSQEFASLKTLKRYERWRMGENLVVLGLTDILTRLFSNQILPIMILRRISLWILEDIQPIKSFVLRLMQGLTGTAPRIPCRIAEPEKKELSISRSASRSASR
jgi:2-octaprenyl-6-methoxyphenol hydroxylase